MVKYTDDDLENIIALAEQDNSNPSRSESLVRRCSCSGVFIPYHPSSSEGY